MTEPYAHPEMLTVWCLCWGDKYPDYYVQRLKHETDKHLTIPHTFACITDRHIAGVYCLAPPNDLPGWWGKVNLFMPGWSTAQNVFLDLDVVIVGNLDDMVEQYAGSNLACARNWAQSGHGGCQSSVMMWRHPLRTPSAWIYSLFDHSIAHWPPVNKPGVLWGDQEWITELKNKGTLSVTHFDPGLVQSYKYHCQAGLPDDAKIIVFHGDPKPSEVDESWFQW